MSVLVVEVVPLVGLGEVGHSPVLTEVGSEAVVPRLRLKEVHLQQRR